MLGVLARRRCLHDAATQSVREPDPLAVRLGASSDEQFDGTGVAADPDPDPLEDRVGVVLDQRDALLAQYLERRERASQERNGLGVAQQPGGLAIGAPTAGAAPSGAGDLS